MARHAVRDGSDFPTGDASWRTAKRGQRIEDIAAPQPSSLNPQSSPGAATRTTSGAAAGRPLPVPLCNIRNGCSGILALQQHPQPFWRIARRPGRHVRPAWVVRGLAPAQGQRLLTSGPSWRWPRTGDHPGRGPEIGPPPLRRDRFRETPAVLSGDRQPGGAAEPAVAPRLLIPEAGNQTPQHQTYPHQPEKRHRQPVACWVWCPVPAVGVGRGSAFGNWHVCPKAADLGERITRFSKPRGSSLTLYGRGR